MTAARAALSVVGLALAGWAALVLPAFLDPGGQATTAEARPIITPEFDSPLELELQGRDVAATGPLECSAGETWTVEATVTQPDVEGTSRSSGACSGDRQHWTVRVPAPEGEEFETGPAQACGVITTATADGEATGETEWCSDVELITLASTSDSNATKVAVVLGAIALVAGGAALVRTRRG